MVADAAVVALAEATSAVEERQDHTALELLVDRLVPLSDLGVEVVRPSGQRILHNQGRIDDRLRRSGGQGNNSGGVNAGRAVGGVQVTTPGGRTATKVGTAGGVAGPGGNGVAGRSGVTVGSGPGGSAASGYRGGVAIGPQGAAAGGSRVGTATGPGGTSSGAARGGVAFGPYGSAAGSTRVAGVSSGTYYRSAAVINGQATLVRQNFGALPKSIRDLPPGGFDRAWRPIAWSALAASGVIQLSRRTTITANPWFTRARPFMWTEWERAARRSSAQQATSIATVGKEAMADPKTGEWQPLGVFAMVQDGETKATNIFQLAVNKDGVIRGEYYNATTDTAEPVYGSVSKKAQLAAWTVADRKTPVYEAGIANLTKDETTMMVHYSKDKAQQFTLVWDPATRR